MPAHPLDNIATIETPEGITLSLQPAGPVVRAIAWCIDVAIRTVVYIALATMLEKLGDFGAGVFFIGMFGMEWFYPVLFEIYLRGATPGKRALRLRVLHDDGTPIGWPASLIRNLLWPVDFLPFCYGFGLVSMLSNRGFQRLGDRVAGTCVVYVDEPQREDTTVASLPEAPRVGLSLEEQQAVLAYADRREHLTDERAVELALMAVPLVAGSGDPEGRLLAVAAWLRGRR